MSANCEEKLQKALRSAAWRASANPAPMAVRP